jgi:hypothetical protein
MKIHQLVQKFYMWTDTRTHMWTQGSCIRQHHKLSLLLSKESCLNSEQVVYTHNYIYEVEVNIEEKYYKRHISVMHFC